MSAVPDKTCNYCNEVKPATKVYFDLSNNMQGLESRCKQCKKESRKKYNYKYDKEVSTPWLNGDDEIYI